ncbi:beta-ketoacyl-ACP synthase II [Sporichthya sp.]|uniref:beta-ketoacyl-ACP synthase II n=1 Tax=Sporichthya sp. TaxID=65475 RepID=UPI0017A2A26F|nr:beta-ketoacyl-ACP synthase II [Sporichthya sp.]MBA3743441.1 beta-ketoacyl-ACP synthase II [Sporichthya sp.]
MSTRTVVVTGVGATTPVGGDAKSTWSALLAGQSGVRTLTEDWVVDVPVQIAARVMVEPSEVMDRVQARRLDRGGQFAVIAARDAWADAGGDEAINVDPERLGVVVASGIGGITTLLAAYDTLQRKGARLVSPLAIPMLMPNGPAAAIGLERTARAGVHTPVSACASGAEAIAMGAEMIRNGRADVVLAGGTEACIHPLPIAAFAAMKAMSTRNDEAEAASRPYDKGRDGFVLGEGSGVLVLESEEHAKARGARIYCVVAGAGMTSDAHHIAQPEPEGAGVTRALRFALENSGITAADVKHVNAHATSTPLGDLAEVLALRNVLGSELDHVAVSATKSMTGHLLGAAGAVEGVATALALYERVAPPTINLDDKDDEADIDIVTVEPRDLPSGQIAALNNSFGFGGHNVCVVFTSY